MHNHAMEADSYNDDLFDARDIARQQERLSSLQYIIALLIQKNEEMRQQLAAKPSEDRM
jgi:hypothetical protein